ncbi:ammonium transporter [Loktanella sp. F6476L]|uniref:ammonium transporter n=1 Tax=Loktanella sp. F6476L TaxID=2926405 RepID=UPI001FF29B92|nr:ammonium transporter [Loktanella sp. F6476L]MCK0121809.1 ammonium transporter [Loktanella sp. F6476L]
MRKSVIGAALLAVLFAGPAAAQQASSGVSPFVMNTLFIVFCGVLCMWMTAGFAMVEAGFVREKNVVNQCAKNIGLFAIASTAFVLSGYGFMFPNGGWIVSGILGFEGAIEITDVVESNADFIGRGHAGAGDIFFQSMFCVAVASIVSGTIAERMKLAPFFIFTAMLTAVIYPIQASWTWGGGFLASDLGFIDLAGSSVVHVVGGVAALTGALFVGARSGRFVDGKKMPLGNYSMPLATIGALILWMGWYGFNAGSYLSFSTDADAANVSRIFLNTNLAAAGGVIVAAFVSYFRESRFDLGFMLNGALAGLVSITAEPLFPSPSTAFLIGMAGGLILFWATQLLDYFQVDDVVGAIPVHLFCGIWGTLAVAISNPDATVLGQLSSVLIIIVYVAVATSLVWFALKETFGLRVTTDTENAGIDQSDYVLSN